MFDDFGLLVGEYNSTLPTLADTEKSELQLDAAGRLILSGRFISDAAFTQGTDAGLMIFGMRHDANTTLATADGQMAPFQLDSEGRLKVATVVSVEPSDAEFLEDSANTSGDAGIHILSVRQDTLATSTSTDGDYADFKVNALGELYVHDTDSLAQLVLANASLDNIELYLNDLHKAEDAAHVSGDFGIQALAVRNDSLSSLVNANGDYASLQVDALGRLKVISYVDAIGTEAYTVTDALAAGGDGLIAIPSTSWVTVASLALGVGENANIYGWQWACDKNAQARIITDDTTDIIVYKMSMNASSNPNSPEHWSEGGRIEIPGAADLEIKLQIAQRGAGPSGFGSGSMHIRKV